MIAAEKRGHYMNTSYKFVKGQGDRRHEEQIKAASAEGYEVKLMAIDPSHIGVESNQQVVVLMEKKG